jgi:hypothetical protein
MPEPFDYDKNERTLQPGIAGSIQNDKHYLCYQQRRERQQLWATPVWSSPVCPLLKVPQERQPDHNHAQYDAVNNEDF